jgi:hypothetical protein
MFEGASRRRPANGPGRPNNADTLLICWPVGTGRIQAQQQPCGEHRISAIICVITVIATNLLSSKAPLSDAGQVLDAQFFKFRWWRPCSSI